MKVIEHYNLAKEKNEPRFSYEIIPPSRGKSLQEIIHIVEKLAPFNPPYIDVTAHAATMTYKELNDGSIKKTKIRKRPGTIGICGVIQNRFNIDTVAHLLCQGFSQSETEDALIELGFLGIHNVLALKGDTPNFSRPDKVNSNKHASSLINQISLVNQGTFLEDSDVKSTLNFCIGAAGYPEKHFEAPNLKEDIKYLKEKVDAGAEYITSQMFFDNQVYFNYIKATKAAGIHAPVIPGIKVITSIKQLTMIPQKFHVDIPTELVDEIMENKSHVKEIGQRWALKQSEELLNSGVPIIHYYVMNTPTTVSNIVKTLQK